MSSVSRVLSDRPDVSPRMRERVMTAVEQLGYQPDMLAQGLRRGRRSRSASRSPTPTRCSRRSSPGEGLRESGYSLLLTNSEGSPDLDADHILLLERRRVDGLILSLAAERHDKTIAALKAVQSPIVLLDRDVLEGIDARCVAFDQRLRGCGSRPGLGSATGTSR